MTTHILCDFDGVFNPFLMINPLSKGYDKFENGWMEGVINKDLIAEIISTIQSNYPDCDMFWASSWEEECNTINDLLNIAKFPIVSLSSSQGTYSWKYSGIKEWLDSMPSGDRAILIDDEVGRDIIALSEEYSFSTIVVDPSVGFDLDYLHSKLIPLL